MTVTATGVSNAANLSLMMVSVSAVVLQEVRQVYPQCSVLDLKASYRGSKYVQETLKFLPEMPDTIIVEQIFRHVARLGRIHPLEPPLKAA